MSGFIKDYRGTPMMIRRLVPDPGPPSRPAPPPSQRRCAYGGCPVVPRCCSHGGRPTWEQYRRSAGAVPPLPAAGPWLPRTTGRWRTGEQALPETITVLNVDTVPAGATVDVLRPSKERTGRRGPLPLASPGIRDELYVSQTQLAHRRISQREALGRESEHRVYTSSPKTQCWSACD